MAILCYILSVIVRGVSETLRYITKLHQRATPLCLTVYQLASTAALAVTLTLTLYKAEELHVANALVSGVALYSSWTMATFAMWFSLHLLVSTSNCSSFTYNLLQLLYFTVGLIYPPLPLTFLPFVMENFGDKGDPPLNHLLASVASCGIAVPVLFVPFIVMICTASRSNFHAYWHRRKSRRLSCSVDLELFCSLVAYVYVLAVSAMLYCSDSYNQWVFGGILAAVVHCAFSLLASVLLLVRLRCTRKRHENKSSNDSKC